MFFSLVYLLLWLVLRVPSPGRDRERELELELLVLRHELLDLTLICGRRHLDHVLRRYAEHYNAQRPHRGLELRTPAGVVDRESVSDVPEVRRVDVLGGLICEYEPVAA